MKKHEPATVQQLRERKRFLTRTSYEPAGYDEILKFLENKKATSNR